MSFDCNSSGSLHLVLSSSRAQIRLDGVYFGKMDLLIRFKNFLEVLNADLESKLLKEFIIWMEMTDDRQKSDEDDAKELRRQSIK